MKASAAKGRQSAHPGWHVIGAMLVASCAFCLQRLHARISPPAGGTELSATEPVLQGLRAENRLGAYWRGRRIGQLYQRIERREEGFSATGDFEATVSAGSGRFKVATSLGATIAPHGELRRLEIHFEGGGLAGRLRVRAVPGALDVTGEVAGMEVARKIPVAEPPVLDVLVPRMLARLNLLAGQRYHAMVFDPQSLSNRSVTYEVVGPEAVKTGFGLVPGIHIVANGPLGKTDMWIDEQGNLLRQKTSTGLELRAESTATGRNSAAEPLDLSEGGLKRLIESVAPLGAASSGEERK